MINHNDDDDDDDVVDDDDDDDDDDGEYGVGFDHNERKCAAGDCEDID